MIGEEPVQHDAEGIEIAALIDRVLASDLFRRGIVDGWNRKYVGRLWSLKLVYAAVGPRLKRGRCYEAVESVLAVATTYRDGVLDGLSECLIEPIWVIGQLFLHNSMADSSNSASTCNTKS